MTVARTSQIAAEVIRTNLAVNARTSQIAVEVLRTNTAAKARLSQLTVEILRTNGLPAPPPAPSSDVIPMAIFFV